MKEILGKVKPANKEQRALLFCQYLAVNKARKYACKQLLDGFSPEQVMKKIKTLFLPDLSYATYILNSARLLLDPKEGYLDIYLAYLKEKAYYSSTYYFDRGEKQKNEEFEIFLPQQWWEEEHKFYENINFEINSSYIRPININFKQIDDLIKLQNTNKILQLIYQPAKKNFTIGLNLSWVGMTNQGYAEFNTKFNDFDYAFLRKYLREKMMAQNIMPFTNIEAVWHDSDLYILVNLDDSIITEKELFSLIQIKERSFKPWASAAAVAVMMLSSSFIPSTAFSKENNKDEIISISQNPFLPPKNANNPSPSNPNVKTTSSPSVGIEPSILPPTLKKPATPVPTVLPTPVMKKTVKPLKPYTTLPTKAPVKTPAPIKTQLKTPLPVKTQLKAPLPVKPQTKPKTNTTAATSSSNASYVVSKGDTLYSIAKNLLGNGTYWQKIYNANRQQIRNPNIIYPGQQLVLPVIGSQTVTTTTTTTTGGAYTVQKGDFLYKIALEQLGNSHRWWEIYQLNRNKIRNPHFIYPGQTLLLP